MRSARLELRVEPELLARIDAAREDVPRSRWVVRVLEAALSEAKEPVLGKQAGPGSVPSAASNEGVRPAAPPRAPSSKVMASYNGHHAGCGCLKCDDVKHGRRKDAG